MATTTTNNGWDIPQSSDYVKLGADAIAELGQDIDTSVGTGLLAWQSWAPTLSQGWTNGTGTWSATYAKIGKIVHVRGVFTTGNGTKGSIMDVSLPVTAVNTGPVPIGIAGYSIGGVIYSGRMLFQTTGTARFYYETANTTNVQYANITATNPAAWAASGDAIRFTLTYEAA